MTCHHFQRTWTHKFCWLLWTKPISSVQNHRILVWWKKLRMFQKSTQKWSFRCRISIWNGTSAIISITRNCTPLALVILQTHETTPNERIYKWSGSKRVLFSRFFNLTSNRRTMNRLTEEASNYSQDAVRVKACLTDLPIYTRFSCRKWGKNQYERFVVPEM